MLAELEITARREESLLRLAGDAAVLTRNRDELDGSGIRNLGDALAQLPGIDTTSFGPAVGRPVVRGFSGQRVRLLSDGIGTGDASAVSPDHAVSLDPRLLRSVDIVRGPATLFYGNAAVGGAVDVQTRIMPEPFGQPGSRGLVEIEVASVDEGYAGFAGLETGDRLWAFGLNAVVRRTSDVTIPGLARRTDVPPGHSHGNGSLTPEPNPRGTLPNSAQEAETFSIGGAVRPGPHRLSAALVLYDTRYGVPFHSHVDSTDTQSTDVKDAAIDLSQWRTMLEADIDPGLEIFESAHLRYAYTDYEHSEAERGRVSSSFAIGTHEFRLELLAGGGPDAAWDAALGFQGGYEGFQSTSLTSQAGAVFPGTDTWNGAVFAVGRRAFGKLTLRSGLRFEVHRLGLADFDGFERTYRTPSWSAGAALALPREITLELGITGFERAPTAAELFANGGHLSSGIFERGSMFQFPSYYLDTERGTGVDAALKHEGRCWTATLTAYYQEFQNYVFLRRTEFTDDPSGLPIFEHLARPALVYGGELEVTADLAKAGGPPLRFHAIADHIRASYEKAPGGDTNPLPRIPPASLRLMAEYRFGRWSAWIGGTHTWEQDRAELNSETTTPGHVLIDAGVGLTVPWGTRTITLALAGTNLGNEEARNHASFLKDVAPLPGRNVSIGLRVKW